MNIQNKKTAYYVLLFAVFLFVCDRFLKILIQKFFFHQKFFLIGHFFSFSFASNPNIAFSLPFYGIGLNVLIIFIIIILLFYLIFHFRNKNYLAASFLFWIFLGSSSNLFDRLRWNYVVDYLDLKFFTIFNLADVLIVGGIIGFLLCFNDKK